MNEEETRTIKYLNNSRQMYAPTHVGKTATPKALPRSKIRHRLRGQNTVRGAVSTLVSKIGLPMEKSVRLKAKNCSAAERNSAGISQIQ